MKILDFFRKPKTPPVYAHQAFVKIWEHIEPLDRGESYEDPLDAVLEKHSLGEVVGGGSLINSENEIVYVNIDLNLVDTDGAVQRVAKELDRLGVPAGTEISFEEDGEERMVRFGRVELLNLYLDGISLSDEVYAVTDTDRLAREINELLEALGGGLRSSWEGTRETALCIQCRNAEQAFARIEPYLLATPSFQNCRVVLRQGNPAMNPREIRLPRHDGG